MAAPAPLFVKGDVNGFWALFADNLANLVLISAVTTFVFGMPPEIVFGHILPGAGVALMAGLGFYAWQARRLAAREGRDDVTALPYGISTPILFVYLFGVIGPVYWMTQDARLAWQVGVAAAFVGGICEMAGAALGPVMKRITPRAGMLGTLAGISLVWIAGVPMAEIFEHPLVGLPALAIVLGGLIAGQRLPFGIPAGLGAISVGVAMGAASGLAEFRPEGLGFYLPVPVLGDLVAGMAYLLKSPELWMVILPIEIYNFVETLNNVESAEAAGDAYDVRTCQLADGAGTLLGALFGNPFPTTVYIGHPAYKRLGARGGYALLVGGVLFVGNVFGMMTLLRGLIPVAAVAPILVYVGLVMVAQAFTDVPGRHRVAVAIALLPHVGDIVAKKVMAAGGYLQSLGGEGLSPAMADAVKGLATGALTPELGAALASQQGLHLVGQLALSRGAILTGLIWGAVVACLIDGRLRAAAAFCAGGWALAAVGIIHASTVGFTPMGPIPLAYGAMALIFVVWGVTTQEGRGGVDDSVDV